MKFSPSSRLYIGLLLLPLAIKNVEAVSAQSQSSSIKKAKEKVSSYRAEWGEHESRLAKILTEVRTSGISAFENFRESETGILRRDLNNPLVMGVVSKSFGDYLNWLDDEIRKKDLGPKEKKGYSIARRVYQDGMVVDMECTPGYVLQGIHIYGPNSKNKKRYDLVWLRSSDGKVINGRICKIEGGKKLLPEASDIANMKAAAKSEAFLASVSQHRNSKGSSTTKANIAAISIVNTTNRTLALRKISIRSPKEKYTAKDVRVAASSTKKISVKGIDVRSMSYELYSKYCSARINYTWKQVGVGQRILTLKTEDLPIIRKQSEFQTWRSRTGHTASAKFLDQIEESDGTKLLLLKSNGESVRVPFEKLTASGQKFSRQISDGSHELLWSVGTNKIRPEHLVGKRVLLVMYRYLDNKGDLAKKPMEMAYGPFVEGTVNEANDDYLRLNCSYKMVQVGLTGRKVSGEKLEDYKISVNGRGIEDRSRGIHVSDAIIESVIVDGLMYRPVRATKKPTFFELGQSQFWKTIEQGKEPKVTFDQYERSAKQSRKAIGGLALLGAFWVTAKAIGVKAEYESRDCIIEGTTYPNTVVKFGKISYSDRRKSDSKGKYRFRFSVLKPMEGEKYILAIEQGGRNIVLWNDSLNPNGINEIDLFNK